MVKHKTLNATDKSIVKKTSQTVKKTVSSGVGGELSVRSPPPKKVMAKSQGLAKPPAIENSGLKVTGPRMKVLQIFENSLRRHLTAEDIYRIFMETREDIGLATIYRVLTQFEQAGILRRQNFEGHKASYELNDQQNHDHFLCSKCGRVEEFQSPEMTALLQKVAKEHHFRINDTMIYLSVDCERKNCKNLSC